MTMKKKLTVTTLAASIVFASIAGLPLSENGLANKLGITTGVASATTLTIQDKLDGLRAELAKDSDGLEAVRATRNVVAGHFNSDDMKILLGNVWTNIANKAAQDHVVVDVDSLFELINGLDLFYDDAGNTIDTLIGSGVIAALFEHVEGSNTLTKQSVIDFQEAALTALKDNKIELLANVAIAFSNGGSSQTIKNALNDIVTEEVLTLDSPISNFLNYYDITLGDLNDAQNRIANAIGTQAKSARTAIESAGIRYLLKDEFTFTDDNSSSTIVQPKLTIFSQSLNPYLIWSLQSGTGVKFENTNTKLVLDGANSGSGVIQARDSKFHLLLYISDTLALNQSVITDPNPVINTENDTDPDVKAKDELNKLADQLKDAPEEKKNEIFKQAQEAVKDAIQQLATLDLKSLIKVEGDTAKPTLNVSEIANKMKEIAAKAKELNDQLKLLNPNAKPEKIQLNLDFGTISAKTTEIPLGKALLDAAIANGIDTVAISMNGLSLGVNPSEFGADTTLKVTNQDTTFATSVTQLPVAAGVYEFEFTSGGSHISSFNTPVKVKIPVPNGSKFDTELLSLAKIVDGKLEFYGGSYANGALNAKRTGFSTYTVVENNVSFGDTASVKAWAGRQIQVAAAKGILEGRAEQAFEPNGLVTRAEFAKMIVKTFSLENASATESFTDVNDSDWYKVYVASAVENGIVNGKEAGKFDPNGNITRAEMAVMSSRALSLKGISLSPAKVEDALKGFTDVNAINASLKDGVALAASEGIVIGEEGNVFNPNANSTRAQAAVVIYRLLNK